ncbi:mitochondrial dimethyladenosine transferase 1-like isoform X2 [Zophobas morio]|uniref:mitochondrial dimethyladenosine transferase 1-like isoform X2 n=1 Tax=Zophobas morio TaxID=2755281 RepID=UPI003082B5BB
MRFPELYSISELLRLYGVSACKSLSQNFILDKNVNDKIVRTLGDLKGHTVIEVGSGPGGLTRSILKAGAQKVIAVEIDQRFMPTLRQLRDASFNRLEIIHSDILCWDMAQTLDTIGFIKQDWRVPKLRLIGNLPFGITAPLVKLFMHSVAERKNAWAYARADMTFLFQREVAERMSSNNTSKVSGRLTHLIQRLCSCKLIYKVPREVFVPSPEVDGAVVRIIPQPLPPPKISMKDFVTLSTHLFTFKRKKCLNGLAQLTESKEDALSILKEAGVDGNMRPELLTPNQMEALVTAYYSRLKA